MTEAPSPLRARRRPGGTRLTLALAGARVAVHSQVPDVLEWVEEALAPSFQPVEADELDVLVEVRNDPPRDPLQSTELLPCFAFESGLVSLPGRADGDSFILEDGSWGIRISIEPGRVSIWELGTRGLLRSTVLRVVRELALVQALGCVAFAGPKLAGKTTTAARIASRMDASIIANDRVLLGGGGPKCTVTGVPTLVSVRPATLELLPDQFRTVPDVDRPSRLTLAEYRVAGENLGLVRAPRALYLTPPQLAHELGSTLIGSAPLACLAVISLAPEVSEFALHPISGDEAAEAIDRFSFGLPADSSERTVFDRAVNRAASLPPSAPVPGLDGVRAFRLSVGEGFLSSAAAPERLMCALFGQ
jgi:hypothetical protein